MVERSCLEVFTTLLVYPPQTAGPMYPRFFSLRYTLFLALLWMPLCLAVAFLLSVPVLFGRQLIALVLKDVKVSSRDVLFSSYVLSLSLVTLILTCNPSFELESGPVREPFPGGS